MKAFIKKVIKYTALTAAVAALSLSAMAGCSSEPAKKYVLPDSMSIILEPPASGTPEDYTALQNVGFVVGKLASRDYYHVESRSEITAKAPVVGDVKQKVEGSKDFSNGILISETINMGGTGVEPKAMQKYFGENEVLIRGAASSDSSDWNGLSTEWSTDTPKETLSYEQYEERYGLCASEFSDFIINEDTFESAEDLQKVDGNYVLTVTLDTETAPAYYVRQMMTMGDLDEEPVFSKIALTICFTEDWTILSLKTDEVYTSVKKIIIPITANCSGGSTITYSYDRADVDISAYESYFKQYETKAE